MLHRATKALLLLFVLSSGVFSACAQNVEGQAVDTEALKTKIVNYMTALYPNLQGLQVTEITKGDGPFLKADITFENRGQTQKNSVQVTNDGRYLVLGQIWDLDVDPNRAKWNDKTSGASERAAKIDLSDRPSKGPADAPVTIVEYSDYQCPYCSRAYQTLEGKLLEEFDGKVRLVFKHFPLEQIHPWAKKGSVAAACAYMQSPEAFWGMHNDLFDNQKAISVENLRDKAGEFAAALNLDKDKFLSCFDENATASVVETDQREGGMIGVQSTPTFVVNGAIVAGAIPWEEMKSYIEFAIEDAGKTAEAN